MDASKLFFIGVFLSFFSIQAQAMGPKPKSGPSIAKDEFCRQAVDTKGAVQFSYFQQRALDPSYRISFQNHGGMFGGGVCWWHSLLTRNSIYLAVFRPDLPRPSADEASRISEDLMNSASVVEVPGYQNLLEFTADQEVVVEKTLELHQFGDALFFGWLNGLQGGWQTTPAALRATMDDLYNEVMVDQRVAYQMLKLPGLVAHAWLVITMEPRLSSSGRVVGYGLNVIDSNDPRDLDHWEYQDGQTSFDYFGLGTFVPYTEHNHSFETYATKILKYCG